MSLVGGQDDAEVYWDLGGALMRAGRLEEAIEEFDRAARLRPDEPKYQITLGVMLGMVGKYELELAAYDRAIKLRPASTMACALRGFALHNSNHLEEALQAFDMAIGLAEHDPEIPDEMRGDLLAALQSSRGSELGHLERYQESLESFDSAIALRPNHAESHHDRGVTLLNLGRRSEALAAFARAEQLQSEPLRSDSPDERSSAGVTLIQGLLGDVMPRYESSPVPIDGVTGAWTATRTVGGGFAVSGGQVILTHRHLVFTPWDMDRTRESLFKLLSIAGAPGPVGKIDDLISKSRLLEPVAIPLTDITDIQVLNGSSLLKPPTARLRLRNGGTFELGILASPTTPNFATANNQAFDDWLARMRLAKPL